MKNDEHTVTLFDSEIGPFMAAMGEYTKLARETISSGDISKSIDENFDRHSEIRKEIMVAASRIYYAMRKQIPHTSED